MNEKVDCRKIDDETISPVHWQERTFELEASAALWNDIQGIGPRQERFPRLLSPQGASDLNTRSVTGEKMIEVPVLRVGEPASKETTQIFRKSDEAAKIYEKSKDAIVKILVPKDDTTVSGTGFFIDKDGTVATDYHVVESAKSIQLKTSDGRVFDARIDKHRSTADLAVLKISNPGAPIDFSALPLAKTADSLQPGDKVYALGHPNGWDKLYLSNGRVDDLKSGATLGFNPQRLSVDAYVHIEPGNSGGPLLNTKGEVVGLARTVVPNATDKSTVLRKLIDTEALKAQFTTVDDLKELLDREQQNNGAKGYLFPDRFRIHNEQIKSSVIAAGSGYALAADLSGKGTIWGNALIPGLAAANLYHTDLPFLKNAFFDGSKADRINAGINVGSDLMMLGGPAFRLNPRLSVVAGAVQMAGAGIRMTNEWLSGRRFD